MTATIDVPRGAETRSSRERRQAGAAHRRVRDWWRGRPGDPRWARPALLALMAGAAVLYFWGLTANGYANSFYSAAVQAGSESWSAFFYGASDAAGSITVDKPPASLWVMALSVRVLGLSSFAILLPQVLMGLATIYLVHVCVRRHFGAGAGLLAGLTMALTPVAVLMFRFNNPDALLVLLMTLGAWATLHAVEKGSIRWMALVGVFVGLGFLTKALQVLLVVPAFGLAFLLLADTSLRRRLLGSLAALGALVVSAGWWVAIVELVPESMRPYIGGSQDNSFLGLTFGYNGLGRLNGEETGSVGGSGGWGETGWLRMFSDSVGDQASWLIPAALILLIGGVTLRGRAPRTDPRRAAYLVWGGWLLVTMATFSLMAGIFHEYYTVALAPATAALVGMGAAEAWQRRDRWFGRVLLAAAALGAGVWGFALLTRVDAYGEWLRILVLSTGVLAALGLLVVDRLARGAVALVLAAALVSGFAGQAAYATSTVTTSTTGSIVTAGPDSSDGPGGGGPGGGGGGPGGGGPGGTPPTNGTSQGTSQGAAPTTGDGGDGAGDGGGASMSGLLDASTPSSDVVDALTADAESFTWVAAAVGSQNAAGLQLATELPVMAIGGFNGSDPSPTLSQFQEYVADGEIHYLLDGGSRGEDGTAAEILEWVAANYSQVEIDGETFYDLTQPLDGDE